MTQISKIYFFSFLFFVTSSSFGQKTDRPQLARTVMWALKYSNLDTLLKLTFNKADFEYLAKNENRRYDEATILYEVKQEQRNVKERYGELKAKSDRLSIENPNWDSTRILQIIYATEKVKENSFSSILVEYSYKGKKQYLEIDSVLTPSGWKIQDDIMNVTDKIKERIKYKNKKMIQY